MSIDIDASNVKSCTRLGKKLQDKDNIEAQTRPLRILLEIFDNVDVRNKTLSKRKGAKHKRRNLGISPGRSLKVRIMVRVPVRGRKILTDVKSANYMHEIKEDRNLSVMKRDLNVHCNKATENYSSSGFVK